MNAFLQVRSYCCSWVKNAEGDGSSELDDASNPLLSPPVTVPAAGPLHKENLS